MLSKAQVASLRSYTKDLNGYVNNQYKIIEQIADREFVVSALYNQAVDGDIPITTTAEEGIELDMVIPAGALVSGVMFDVQTALTASGGAGTIDVQVTAANTTEESGVIVNDHTEANLSVGAKQATVVPQKLTADSSVYLTAGTAKFEKGKMRVFVKYYMARD